MTTYREFCIRCINEIDRRLQTSDLTLIDTYQVGRELTYLEMVLRDTKDLDTEMIRHVGDVDGE